MLKIIEDNNGTVEFLGDCFSSAERKTNVEIALISITNNEKNLNLLLNMKKIILKLMI